MDKFETSAGLKYTSCKICSSEISHYLTEFRLVKCKSCGLCFFEELQGVESSKSLYRDLYNKDIGYRQHRLQEQKIKQGSQPGLGHNKKVILKEIITEKKKYSIAEIGAGVGVVAKKLLVAGHNYIGFELNEEIASNAAQKGLPIKSSGYQGLGEFNEQFDAVIAFEVLEHIDNLNECLRMIIKSLKPNGLLGFTVPNSDKFKNYEKEQSKLYQSPPPVHVNFFNMQSLHKLLLYYGLTPILIKVRPFPYMNLTDLNMYKFLMKALVGKYNGPNIMCVAQKQSNLAHNRS